MKDPGHRTRWAAPLSVSLLSLAIAGLLPWRLVAQPPSATVERLAGASATETQDNADDRVASGAAYRAGRPLATVSVGEFNVTVDNVRWAEREVSWVESGFPFEANHANGENGAGGPSGIVGGSSGGSSGSGTQPSSAKLSPRELASKHGVDAGALRKRLDRWRYEHDAGYVEVSNPVRNKPKYLYDESAVVPVIEALKAKPVGRKRATDGQEKKF